MPNIQDWDYGGNGGSIYPVEQVTYDRWKRIKTNVNLDKLTDRWEAWNEVEDRVLDWIDNVSINWFEPTSQNKRAADVSFKVAKTTMEAYRELGGQLGATNFSTLRMVTKYAEAVCRNQGEGPLG